MPNYDTDRIKEVMSLHDISQKEIGIAIGYVPRNAQSAVANALGGRNDKALRKIIDYICTEQNYNREDFIKVSYEKDIRELKKEVAGLGKDLKELKEILIDYIKNTQ